MLYVQKERGVAKSLCSLPLKLLLEIHIIPGKQIALLNTIIKKVCTHEAVNILSLQWSVKIKFCLFMREISMKKKKKIFAFCMILNTAEVNGNWENPTPRGYYSFSCYFILPSWPGLFIVSVSRMLMCYDIVIISQGKGNSSWGSDLSYNYTLSITNQNKLFLRIYMHIIQWLHMRTCGHVCVLGTIK